MLEEIQKNTLLGLQWDPNWNCQEVWSSYLHPSEYSRWSSQGGANMSPPPVLIGLKTIGDFVKYQLIFYKKDGKYILWQNMLTKTFPEQSACKVN